MITSHSDLPSSEFIMYSVEDGDRCLAFNVLCSLHFLLSPEGHDIMLLFLSSYTIISVSKIIPI